MGKPEKKLKKILLTLGITGAVYGSFRCLLPLVVPFLLAWGLAVVLRPSASWVALRCRVRVPVWAARGDVGDSGRGSEQEQDGTRGQTRVLSRRHAQRRPRTLCVSVGVVGVVELLLIAALLSVLFYMGGRKLCAEASLLASRIPVWIDRLDVWLTAVCHDLENTFCLKSGYLVLLMREMLRGLMVTLKNAAMPYLMVNSVSLFCWGIQVAVMTVVVLIATGLSLQEMDTWKQRFAQSIYHREYALIARRLSIVANAYVKTQGVIMVLTAAICTAGFWLMGNPYYILAGIGIGLLDALPVFGTGTVLIPWAIFLFMSGQWGKGIGVLALYLTCYFLREILEAKMMGDRVGLSPLETLIAIYVGLQLFGLFGVFLGPIGLLLIMDLVEELSQTTLPS